MTTGKCTALLLLGPSCIAGLGIGLALGWQASPALTFWCACVGILVCGWLLWQLWRHG